MATTCSSTCSAEPGLRRHATHHLHEVLSGSDPTDPADSRRLLVYGVASLVWTVLSAFYLVLALPLAVQLLRPLWTRVYRPRPEVVAR